MEGIILVFLNVFLDNFMCLIKGHLISLLYFALFTSFNYPVSALALLIILYSCCQVEK